MVMYLFEPHLLEVEGESLEVYREHGRQPREYGALLGVLLAKLLGVVLVLPVKHLLPYSNRFTYA
jgi:hypothetical protein